MPVKYVLLIHFKYNLFIVCKLIVTKFSGIKVFVLQFNYIF